MAVGLRLRLHPRKIFVGSKWKHDTAFVAIQEVILHCLLETPQCRRLGKKRSSRRLWSHCCGFPAAREWPCYAWGLADPPVFHSHPRLHFDETHQNDCSQRKKFWGKGIWMERWETEIQKSKISEKAEKGRGSVTVSCWIRGDIREKRIRKKCNESGGKYKMKRNDIIKLPDTGRYRACREQKTINIDRHTNVWTSMYCPGLK